MRELATVVAAWEHTARSVLALGRDCDADDLGTPTECPGWTVKDQLAHVVGVERGLLPDVEDEPPHELPPDLPHVRGHFARRIEVAVDRRRGVPGAEVVAELAQVLDARSALLVGAGADDVVVGLRGETTLGELMTLRTFDVWAHEQDLRRALQRPGGLGSPAAALAVGYARAGLGRVVAKGAKVEPGRTVVVAVTGPVSFTEAVRVQQAEPGRMRGTVLGHVPPIGDGADVRVSMDTESFMRRSCGRWSVARTPVTVDGDADLAARVLEAMAVTP
jgi:uncharacterized protein (TIGR03083 family)